MIALNCDMYQTGSLIAYGEWAPQEVNLCLSMINRGDTVLDVGANIGSFTMAFAHKVGHTGNVHAFEPQRIPYMCLAGNVVLNNLAEFTHAYRLALSDKEGTVLVPNLDPRRPNNSGGARMDDEQNIAQLETIGPPTEIQCRRIDDSKLQACHFIKIDVEGMESKVLAGASDTITKYRPKIFAETLPWEHDNTQAMCDFFKAHDYIAWSIETRLSAEDNIRLHPVQVFGEQRDSNCIAIHKDQEPPAIVEELIELDPDND